MEIKAVIEFAIFVALMVLAVVGMILLRQPRRRTDGSDVGDRRWISYDGANGGSLSEHHGGAHSGAHGHSGGHDGGGHGGH